MKTILITCLIFLSSGVALRAQEAPKRLNIYLAGGATVPASPENFRLDHNTGYHLFTAIGYTFSPIAEIIGRFELHIVSLDADQVFDSRVLFEGGGVDMLIIGADIAIGKRRTASAFRPFLLIGGGWSRLSQTGINTDLAFEQYAPVLFDNQTRFYYNLGIGLDILPASNLKMFFLGRFMDVTQDSDHIKLVPLTLGFRF